MGEKITLDPFFWYNVSAMKLARVFLLFVFVMGSMTCGTIARPSCCEKKENGSSQKCHGQASDSKPAQAKGDCCCRILADIPKAVSSLKSVILTVFRTSFQWVQVPIHRSVESFSVLIRGSPPVSKIQVFYFSVFASLAPPVK